MPRRLTRTTLDNSDIPRRCWRSMITSSHSLSMQSTTSTGRSRCTLAAFIIASPPRPAEWGKFRKAQSTGPGQHAKVFTLLNPASRQASRYHPIPDTSDIGA